MNLNQLKGKYAWRHLQNNPIFINWPSTFKLFFKTEFQKDFSLQIKTFVSGSNHRKAFDERRI